MTKRQLEYEWMHLRKKTERRSPAWSAELPKPTPPGPHPLFRVIAGGIADWEVVSWLQI